MSTSSTETKTFFGIVVATDEGDVDPYGMGRVKVLCPSIHHKDISLSELPWCTIASDASGLGDHTHQRQLVVGSVVEVYYSGGTKSSAQGMVRSVINGVHDETPPNDPTQGRETGENLTNINGYIRKARRVSISNASGPSQIGQGTSDRGPQESGIQTYVSSQTQKHPTGGTGGSEVISGEYKQYPNMHMREGIDSSVTSKGFIRTSKPLRTINTAEQWRSFANDHGPGSSATDVPAITNTCQDYEFDPSWKTADPTLTKGYQNFAKNLVLKYNSNNNTLNFSNEGNKTILEEWKAEAKGKIAGVKTHKQLQDVLFELQSQKTLERPLLKIEKTDTVPTPFGDIIRRFKGNGNLQFENFEEKNNKKWEFIKDCVNVTPTARSLLQGGLYKIKDCNFTDHDGKRHEISEFKSKVGLFEMSLVPGEVFLRIQTNSAKKIWQEFIDFAEAQRDLNIEFGRFGSGEFITKKPVEEIPETIQVKGAG